MAITLKDVEYVANLAKLELSEEEKKRFQKELDNIIKYIDQLNEVDTENVPITSHANAPEKKDGFFKVPRVIG